MSESSVFISIIVPVYNEHAYLREHGDKLADWQCEGVELIFVDGGSQDNTVAYLRAQGHRVLHSDAGRAKQMNVGACHSKGDVLWFLHIDTTLPGTVANLLPQINDCFMQSRWGFFRIRLDASGVIFSLIAAGINFRSKVFRVGTGDQGLFFSRQIFERWGGFPDIPLMEDIALSRYAKKYAKPRILPVSLITSARRWQTRGVVKTILFMWWLQLAYKCGVSPVRLHKWYR